VLLVTACRHTLCWHYWARHNLKRSPLGVVNKGSIAVCKFLDAQGDVTPSDGVVRTCYDDEVTAWDNILTSVTTLD